MKTFYYVSRTRNGVTEPYKYFEHKDDAIKCIAEICDAYRDAPKIRGVTRVYEPYREAYESGQSICVYWGDIEFEAQPTLKYGLESNTMY